ncbi:3'-5' exonuclease [Cellulosimicrobium composti]|uniref:AAA family ATPase n=1 Tax=Cellulosimicrobium composti TaxID=2672572 RepID=A0ABX0B968_9MICO|nr:3'-5' exonuclease [Cellulosimicrobium composti]NDO88498.1 AAA family ATPase [Cellulosimicrobium composti]
MSSTEAMDAAAKALVAQGFETYRDDAGIRPQLLAHHPVKGVVALDYATDNGASVQLNRKLELLREEVPAIRRVAIERRVVDARAQATDRRTVSVTDARTGAWAAALRHRPIDDQVADGIRAAFAPTAEVPIPRRDNLSDRNAGARVKARLRLDADQAKAVEGATSEVGVVEGPPGSGKTIVLAARARKLARENPGWRIQFLCYNRMLVPYLRDLVSPYPNIEVSTFARFAASLDHRVDMRDPARAASDAARAVAALRLSPAVDAVMVDEAQDFWLPWLQVAIAAVRRGRGGVLLAGDSKQSLYRYESGIDELKSWLDDFEVFELDRAYRSTKQILEVTSALSDQSVVRGLATAFDGPPVDLIYSHDKAGQGDAVANDIAMLVKHEQVEYQNIGVLVTRKFLVGTVAEALKRRGIPFEVMWANKAGELDLRDPTVKVMTVHSAKGIDFDIVFLVGLENLPDGSSDEDVQQGRTGYVGMTRAKDRLVITYSRDNAYLERIRHVDMETLNRWMWPDDFVLEA